MLDQLTIQVLQVTKGLQVRVNVLVIPFVPAIAAGRQTGVHKELKIIILFNYNRNSEAENSAVAVPVFHL